LQSALIRAKAAAVSNNTSSISDELFLESVLLELGQDRLRTLLQADLTELDLPPWLVIDLRLTDDQQISGVIGDVPVLVKLRMDTQAGTANGRTGQDNFDVRWDVEHGSEGLRVSLTDSDGAPASPLHTHGVLTFDHRTSEGRANGVLLGHRFSARLGKGLTYGTGFEGAVAIRFRGTIGSCAFDTGIVHIKQPRTLRMRGRLAAQEVSWFVTQDVALRLSGRWHRPSVDFGSSPIALLVLSTICAFILY